MKTDPPAPARLWTHPLVIAAGLLLVTLIFRSGAGLAAAPPGLFGDEATDGLDALDVLAGRGAIFFPANYGREGLHMWIVAAMFRLFGVTPEALRLPSFAAGLVTVLATYWLGRELVEAYRAASPQDRARNHRWFRDFIPLDLIPIAAALYTATSFWHLHFSRFGIRGVFTPMCAALAFAAFWRGVNRGSWRWFAFSGFFLGLASHFYTAARFLPLFLGGFLLVQWLIALITRRQSAALLARHFKGIALLYLIAFLVFLPLGVYFWQHPGSFMQRASEVAAFGAESPWLLMGRAALANVLQFFVPGRGDPEQFYNLPHRAVFDPVTAVLALIGIAVLLWRSGRASALFLLLWFPAMLLPSFLATDRWPTLPRVLGVIPGVYFFPAVGLVGVGGLLRGLLRRPQSKASGSKSSRLPLAVAAATMVALLALHAASSWRDYFRAWAPSQETFDAFEGDMAAAWRWLADAQPLDPTDGQLFLSSDIYRHPTFMLLGERATVQTYFAPSKIGLSWFDGRRALPIPPEGKAALYLIGSSAALPSHVVALLEPLAERETISAPDGSPSLEALRVAADSLAVDDLHAWAGGADEPVAFSPLLELEAAGLAESPDGAAELRMVWRVAAPDTAAWGAYRLELVDVDGGWQASVPFDGYRPPEWTPGAAFLAWTLLDGLPDGATELRLRLVDAVSGQPLVTPNAPDGWHTLRVD